MSVSPASTDCLGYRGPVLMLLLTWPNPSSLHLSTGCPINLETQAFTRKTIDGACTTPLLMVLLNWDQ